MSRALHKPLSRSILLLGCLAAALSSCRTAKSVVEAVEVKPSGFLTHAKDLKEDRQRSPFLLNWWSTDKRLLAAADRCRKIYVAPVAYDQVRADNTIVAAVEHDAAWRTRHLPAMAQYIRTKFGDAFRKAKDPRYAVVDAPAADALTLQLSLLEWGPNTYTGVLSRQVVDFFTFNVGGEATMRNTRGYMAIEGRVVEPRSRQPVFEFADKEYAKIVLLISIQDFRRNGQAYFAVKEWAAQLEKLLRAKPGEKVSDSLPAVLFNY
ncbi:MAG: DUF3313 family protein [Prosthecobacter sp.]